MGLYSLVILWFLLLYFLDSSSSILILSKLPTLECPAHSIHFEPQTCHCPRPLANCWHFFFLKIKETRVLISTLIHNLLLGLLKVEVPAALNPENRWKRPSKSKTPLFRGVLFLAPPGQKKVFARNFSKTCFQLNFRPKSGSENTVSEKCMAEKSSSSFKTLFIMELQARKLNSRLTFKLEDRYCTQS